MLQEHEPMSLVIPSKFEESIQMLHSIVHVKYVFTYTKYERIFLVIVHHLRT